MAVPPREGAMPGCGEDLDALDQGTKNKGWTIRAWIVGNFRSGFKNPDVIPSVARNLDGRVRKPLPLWPS